MYLYIYVLIVQIATVSTQGKTLPGTEVGIKSYLSGSFIQFRKEVDSVNIINSINTKKKPNKVLVKSSSNKDASSRSKSKSNMSLLNTNFGLNETVQSIEKLPNVRLFIFRPLAFVLNYNCKYY